MAETVARRGGIAVIPQDIPVDVVADVIAWVKCRHLVYDTAAHARPRSDTVGDALGLLPKRAHGAVIVVEATAARSAWSPRPTAPASTGSPSSARSCRSDLLTLPAGVDPQEAFEPLHDGGHRLAPVVDARRPAASAS